MMRIRFRLVLSLLLPLLVMAPACAGNPDALWQIVHDRCVPDQQTKGVPDPCRLVDLAGGTAVLKDRDGDTQFLLIPTAKVTGIEDPAILAPGSPNYFAAAWSHRDLVDQVLHRTLPRDDIGLAINSAYGRSQNQLHIHIDCLRPDVVAALRANVASVGPAWTPFPVALAGQPYIARRINGLDAGDANPFTLLADGVADARAEMGKWTLAAVTVSTAVNPAVSTPGSAGGTPELILLAGHVDLAAGDRASSEELQDHACVIKQPG